MRPFKVSTDYPPNWEDLRARFGVIWGRTAVTYGDTVYSASPLTPDLKAHEAHHIEQQAAYPGGHEAWWKRYMEDETFRCAQELEAYQVQFQYIEECVRDRNVLHRHRDELARQLAGRMYGCMISYTEAYKLIGQRRALEEEPLGEQE